MTNPISLKDLERKAFKSTYQDGLWDLYFGVLTAINGVFFALPDAGDASWLRVLMMTSVMLFSWFLFWLAKRYITLPRLGQVKFGRPRKRKMVTLAIIMGIFVIITVFLVFLPAAALAFPELKSWIDGFLPQGKITSLPLGGFVGVFLAFVFSTIAYFNDFPRGYFIAVVIGASFFFALWLREFVFLLGGAAIIALPGAVLLARFLRTYPLPVQE